MQINNFLDSLIATIKKYAPTVFPNITTKAEPISPIPPEGYFGGMITNLFNFIVVSLFIIIIFDFLFLNT